MRKLLLLVTILTFCAFVTFAQNPSSQPSSQYPSSQQPSSGAPPDQSSQTATGAQAGEQTIDGCIIKKSTTYYIQPSGGAPTKLGESPDVASHEGQHVVVHGSQQGSSASGAAGTNP